MYEKSEEKGYAPASSLLGDYYFFGRESEYERARCHFNNVLKNTDDSEPEDAYIRSTSLKKLGILDFRSTGRVNSEPFESSLEVIRRHLKSNFGFLLDHDPPGLWEMIEEENKQVDDVLGLERNLDGFAKVEGWFEGDTKYELGDNTPPNNNDGTPSSVKNNILALRKYTLAVRDTEGLDSTFALDLRRSSLETFGASSSSLGGSWGLTYLSSFFRVFGNPHVQRSLRRDEASGKITVLGSALGNACVWPTAAFGFNSVGFDLLGCCTEKSDEIVDGLLGEGGRRIRERVEFVNEDCLSERGRAEMEKADVIWSNDFSWPKGVQESVEEVAFASMPSGAALVLYRPPRLLDKLKWTTGAKINGIPTSWDPALSFYVLVK